jgi:nucleotide-binding universal stress UspA family protein
MKILIAYDGSECSEAAIRDLQRAGLPDTGVMVVLSVAELAPDAQTVPYYAPGMEGFGSASSYDVAGLIERTRARQNEIVQRGVQRLRDAFPRGWSIQPQVVTSSAQRGIIEKADDWKPDLIVVGSHNASTIGRMFMGSVSHSVLTHARCSVRVGRDNSQTDDRAPRILIAVDGSVESAHAVHVAADRKWPEGTHARVVCVIDSAMQTAGPATHAFAAEWMKLATPEVTPWTKAVGQAVVDLKRSGLTTNSLICEGHPKQKILAEADEWGATSIFLGARGLGRVSRLLLGSVSLAVASRANCSVEVVRAGE